MTVVPFGRLMRRRLQQLRRTARGPPPRRCYPPGCPECCMPAALDSVLVSLMAVCPPKGRPPPHAASPVAITPSTSSGVSGSKYSRSAVSKSVETVSGLLLIITTVVSRLSSAPTRSVPTHSRTRCPDRCGSGRNRRPRTHGFSLGCASRNSSLRFHRRRSHRNTAFAPRIPPRRYPPSCTPGSRLRRRLSGRDRRAIALVRIAHGSCACQYTSPASTLPSSCSALLHVDQVLPA